MSKEGYFKFLGQLLREHYTNFKETGVDPRDSKQFISGYLTAARILNAVYQKELTDYMERVHFDIFHMTIAERKKSFEEKPDLSEDEIEIPTFKRKGIRLKF